MIQKQIMNKTTHMTYEGSHAEHTTDKFGKFAHPFKQVGRDIDSIYYKKSNTFSMRLNRSKKKKT